MAKARTNEVAKVMPNNLEVEQAVLGCVLIDPEVSVNIISKVHDYDFYSETHKAIYRAIVKLYDANVTIDILTLTDELEKEGVLASVGGVSYLTTLTNAVPSAANHENYVAILRKNSTLRQLIEACGQVIEKAYNSEDGDACLALAEKNIYDIGESGQTS